MPSQANTTLPPEVREVLEEVYGIAGDIRAKLTHPSNCLLQADFKGCSCGAIQAYHRLTAVRHRIEEMVLGKEGASEQ